MDSALLVAVSPERRRSRGTIASLAKLWAGGATGFACSGAGNRLFGLHWAAGGTGCLRGGEALLACLRPTTRIAESRWPAGGRVQRLRAAATFAEDPSPVTPQQAAARAAASAVSRAVSSCVLNACSGMGGQVAQDR